MYTNAADHIKLLYEKFKPVFKAWKINQAAGTKLSGVPSSAKECMYDDIYNMGIIISMADGTGQPIEIRHTAELLVIISSLDEGSAEVVSSYNQSIKEEKEDRLVQEIKEIIKSGIKMEPSLPNLIAISREFDNRNRTKTSVEIVAIFNKLLDSFIIRDGILSSEELHLIKVYEGLWKSEY